MRAIRATNDQERYLQIAYTSARRSQMVGHAACKFVWRFGATSGSQLGKDLVA